MNEIELYLNRFEDFELAFFWKYKLCTYMEPTQREIMSYIKKRRLSEDKIRYLIEEYSEKEFPKEEFRCPRCKSKKLSTKRTSMFTGKIYYRPINLRNVHYICSVCGLIFEPAERAGSSLLKKIFMRILKWKGWDLG